MPRRLALAACVLGFLIPAARAEIRVVARLPEGGNGPAQTVEVETRFYKATFSLPNAGAASSFIYKSSNVELRAENYYSRRNDLFTEDLGLGPRLPAVHRVVRQSADDLVLEFEVSQKPDPEREWVTQMACRRRLTFREDTPAVRVETTIENRGTEPRRLRMGIFQGLSLGRVATAVCLPAADGRLLGLDRADESSSRFIYAPDLAGAWMGGVSEGGLGAAFSFDWADVDGMKVDLWKTVGSAYLASLREREVTAGGSVTFAATFLPFTGFGALDGMQDDLAGGIRVGAAPVFPDDVATAELKTGANVPLRVFLASGRERSVKVLLRCTRKEDGRTVLDQELSAVLKAGETATLESRMALSDEGLYVLSASVSGAGGVPLLMMEKGLTVGRSRLTFTATLPAGAKRGERVEGGGVEPASFDPQFTSVDRSFVTPHLPLAKNHAGGAVRVFFAAPADCTLGHLREISQRSDLEYDYHAIAKIQSPPDTLNFGDVRRFRAKLRATDAQVLVSLGLNWQVGFPKELIAEIMERVKGGMGLVVAARSEVEQVELFNLLGEAKSLASSPLPPCAVPLPPMKCYELGKGRVAVVMCGWSNYRDGGEAALGQWTSVLAGEKALPVAEFRWHGYEYAYAALGELARWAARKEGPARVTRVALRGDRVAVDLRWDGAATDVIVQARVRTRRWEERTAGEAKVKFAPGAVSCEVPLKARPDAGPCALEVFARDPSGKLLAFASAGAVGGEGVDLKVDVMACQPAEKTGTCRVEWSGKVGDARLRFRLVDRLGRVVVEDARNAKLDGTPQGVEFPLGKLRPLTVYHEAVATLESGGRVLAETTADVFLIPAKPDYADRFVLAVADAPERRPLHLQALLPLMRSLGLTMHSHSYNMQTLYASGGTAASNAGGLSLKQRYALPPVKPSLDDASCAMSPPFLPSAASITAMKEKWQAAVRAAAAQGARLFPLDDERRFPVDFDRSPGTMAGFREWLKGRYAGIAELNRNWGASFADFSEVVPKKRAEVQVAPNLAPWLEFQMYLGTVAGEHYMKAPAEWAAEISPDLSVGEHGVYEPRAEWPVDWARYARYYRYTLRYGDSQGVLEELFRCFGDGACHGRWQGYGMLDITPDRRAEAWASLLNGGSFCAFWAMTDNGFWNYGVATSDQRPTKGYAALAKEEFPDLTGGIDRLILNSRFTDDGIAIGYSYPSWMADVGALGQKAKAVIEELGYQHRFVNLEGLAPGQLGKDGVRLLVLAETGCLSAAQAEAIRGFVEDGGTLFALGRCGWRDLHGAPHARPVIEDLTGVEIAGPTPSPGMEMRASGADAPLKLRACCNGVKVATAVKVLAESAGTPLWTVREAGKGRVYWLNSRLEGHNAVFKGGVAEEKSTTVEGPQALRRSHWRVFERVLREAGIAVRCRIEQGGQPLFDTETWYYETPSKRTLFVAHYLLREVKEPLTVRLGRKGQVYEMRSHRDLGRAGTFAEVFLPGHVKVFAVLDYAVAGVKASLPVAKVAAGGELACDLAIETDGPKADLHAVRLRIEDAQGREIPGSRDVTVLREGAGRWTWPVALNVPPGRYTLRATDVTSGREGAATFDVAASRLPVPSP
ncbi:MAG: beta-galactosidase [Verrucomicrobiia bacterium]